MGPFKVGITDSRTLILPNKFTLFHQSPLKMMKNPFYFFLKALFILKIFRFLL